MRYRNVPVDALFVLIALSVGIDLDLYRLLSCGLHDVSAAVGMDQGGS